MGISDAAMHVEVDGDMYEIGGYLDKLEASSKGIQVKKLANILRNCECDDDEFKVTFALFTLCSVLCLSGESI